MDYFLPILASVLGSLGNSMGQLYGNSDFMKLIQTMKKSKGNLTSRGYPSSRSGFGGGFL